MRHKKKNSGPGNDELRFRLGRAHRSMSDMAVFAGKLLQDVEQLKRDVASRDKVIVALREQLSEAEATVARAASFG